MKKNDEFYVSYIEGSLGASTKSALKKFVFAALLLVIGAALVFALTQKKFKNSTFELSSDTKITGVFHESPYPMLRVQLAENTFKNVLLLGFGKSSANPFLKKLRSELADLKGKKLSVEGNLIYYNGKTLIQITDDEKVSLEADTSFEIPQSELVSEMTLQGEIIDPKCYFGVMKPGKGKIHRSCAVLCISGGMPPVLATTDANNLSAYYLLTDTQGNPIHKDILPFVGKPAEIKGIVEKNEDWYTLKIDIKDINLLNTPSTIY
jgi:hypothetical protein